MKHVTGGEFTTQQMSIEETISELYDCLHIAKIQCRSISKDSSVPQSARDDAKYALQHLEEAETYIPYLKKKAEIALRHTPSEIQTKEFL